MMLSEHMPDTVERRWDVGEEFGAAHVHPRRRLYDLVATRTDMVSRKRGRRVYPPRFLAEIERISCWEALAWDQHIDIGLEYEGESAR